MEFGKVANVDRIRFELPDQDPRTLAALEWSRSSEAARILIGAPVWASKEWVGTLYPARTQPRDFLKLYSRRFNAIELNSTFYGIPEPKTIENWRDSVPGEFRFAPKLYQGISHETDRSAVERLTSQFFSSVLRFGEKLGTSFLQLPPHFAPSSLGVLERILRAVPSSAKLAVEFRHPAWFQRGKIRDEAFDLLGSCGVGTVITDVAGRRDVLHSSLPVARTMIRFVGNELHPSDFTRTDEWVLRLRQWFAAGLDELSLFIHHPTNIHVPELASYWVDRLNEVMGIALPRPLTSARPDQEESQLTLL